ncbi:MAG: hypothetical protein AB7T37_17755 [Dehalococcoidia bacterium]
MQLYRKRLLGLGSFEGTASVDSHSRTFIRLVLTGPIETRPNSEGARDVLQSMGLSPVSTTRFVDAYDSAVWAAL